MGHWGWTWHSRFLIFRSLSTIKMHYAWTFILDGFPDSSPGKDCVIASDEETWGPFAVSAIIGNQRIVDVAF